MTALWIIVGILAFLALLLCLPVCLVFRYEETLQLELRYAFLRFDLLRSDGGTDQKEEQVPEKAKNSSQKNRFPVFSKLRRKYGFSGAVRELLLLVKSLVSKTLWLLSKVQIRNFRCRIVVASDDAAKTAMEYGVVSAVLYPVFGWLYSQLRFDHPQIDLSADYAGTEPSAFAEGEIRCHTFLILLALVTEIRQLTNLFARSTPAFSKSK